MNKFYYSRGIMLSVLLVFILLLLPAKADEPATEAVTEDQWEGGTLRLSVASKFRSLTPFISTGAELSEVQDWVVESLFRWESDETELVPYLVDHWSLSEDQLTLSLQLRKDVVFSNGEKMSADDVLFTYQLIHDANFNAPRMRAHLHNILSMEKAGPYQIVITYREVTMNNFSMLSMMPVLPKSFYGNYSMEALNRSTHFLVGSGPYQLKNREKWKPGGKIVLERNPHYWGKKPNFQRIQYEWVQSGLTRLEKFTKGELDMIQLNGQMQEQLSKQPELMKQGHVLAYVSRSTGYRYIAWNQKTRDGEDSIFKDKRVRQAMTYLIPREKIIKEFMHGRAMVATGPFQPESMQSDPSLKARPHDPEKALALLKEAGFTYDKKLQRMLDQNGKVMSFTLMYPRSTAHSKIVTFIQDQMRSHGINMQVQQENWPSFIQKMEARDFDALTLAWTGGLETDIHTMFHSSQQKMRGHNFMHYSNPDLDAIIDQARKEMDMKKRMKLWQKAHAILYEDQPYSFLVVTQTTALFNKRIKNVNLNDGRLNPISEWKIEAPAK